MKILQIALLIALPFAAAVGTSTKDALAASCDANACTGTIRELWVNGDASNPMAEVRLDTDAVLTGCRLGGWTSTSNRGTTWHVPPGKENVLKVLLAAYLAGKPVRLKADTVAMPGTAEASWPQCVVAQVLVR